MSDLKQAHVLLMSAERDISALRGMADAAVFADEIFGFHAQQAAEKLLKAWLALLGETYPTTHDLARLLAMLRARDVEATRFNELKESDSCDQGQTHGHKGFLLAQEEAKALMESDPRSRAVLKPYLTADEFLSSNPPAPGRYVMDFQPRSMLEARAYAEAFARIEKTVLPDRQEKANNEDKRNREASAENQNARVNHHHQNFLNQWWLLSYPRSALMKKLRELPRYVACGQVTKRPIFVFVDANVNPNAALQVFTFADDYSFGILQSDIHWRWFVERCSTFKGDFRYTSTPVYDSFPWPQAPSLAQVREVARAAVDIRLLRTQLMEDHDLTLRELYRSLELPGDSPLKRAHARLDAAVRKAYKMRANEDALELLFGLNQKLAEQEASSPAGYWSRTAASGQGHFRIHY